MLRIRNTTRDDLIKIAENSNYTLSLMMEAFINGMIKRGRYADATQDEIQRFEMLLGLMESTRW